MKIMRALFVVCLLTLAPSLVQAQSLHPQAPFIRLSPGGMHVQVVTDRQNRTHAVWMEPASTPAQIKVVTIVNGQPGPIAVVPIPQLQSFSLQRQVAIAVGPERLHLAYLNQGGPGQVCYLSRPLAGTTWSTPDCLPPNVETQWDMQIIALDDDSVAVAWHVFAQTIGAALYRPGSGWQQLPPPNGDTPHDALVRLASDGRNVHVFWRLLQPTGPGNAQRNELVGRTLQGNVWGPQVSISGFDPSHGQWNVGGYDVAADRDGTLHVAYTLFAPKDDGSGPRDRLFYRRGPLSNLEPGEALWEQVSEPSLAVRDGVVDIAYGAAIGPVIGDARAQNREIIWSRRTTAWSNPRTISYSALNSGRPSVAIAADGGSAVLWQDALSIPDVGEVLLAQRPANTSWRERAPTDTDAVRRYRDRADVPVAMRRSPRSWLWGPQQWASSTEPYLEAPVGERSVFYYDKARIEVTDPNLASNEPNYLTNGLLVTELASGRLQYGNYLTSSRPPAPIEVAGDTANLLSPTYASFRELVYLPEINQYVRADNRVGQMVRESINRAGVVATGTPPNRTTYAHYVEETGHNIAAPFWSFLNQRGLVYENDRYVDGLVFQWVTTMGYPIAEPYWTSAIVRGVQQPVLVQLFQRRVLTYTPDNPAAFQVEMGNVGQHYYLWRYGSAPWVGR